MSDQSLGWFRHGAAAVGCLCVIATAANGQTNLFGVTATSFTMTANAANRPSGVNQLSLDSASILSYNPLLVNESTTAPIPSGQTRADWQLDAVAFGDPAPPPPGSSGVNVFGGGAQRYLDGFGGPDFAAGDTVTMTYELVFSSAQEFFFIFGQNGANPTGTLTQGLVVTDLATTPFGTVFGPGNYTLTMSGTAIDTAHSYGVGAVFSALVSVIPGSGLAAIGSLGLAGLARRRRR